MAPDLWHASSIPPQALRFLRPDRTLCCLCLAIASLSTLCESCFVPHLRMHAGAELARALVPRSVTVALALPIAAQLHAPASITAAGVCLTGLLGANFVQVGVRQTCRPHGI